MITILLIVTLCVMVFGMYELVFAEQYGITLSKTCMVMIKNNITSDCPTYDTLALTFTDNTNQKILGQLENIDGIIQRGKGKVLHPEKYYMYERKDILWIDPPDIVRKNIKMVSIEASIPEYKIGSESKIMNDYTIAFGKDRYINANCSEIKVSSKHWLMLVGDALTLLKHKCDLSHSTFNHKVTHTFVKSYQDISTSYKWKLDQWIKDSKNKCLQEYGACKTSRLN